MCKMKWHSKVFYLAIALALSLSLVGGATMSADDGETWRSHSRWPPSPVPGRSDVNGDGRVNVLDLVLVGQHIGETSTPGWIPEDVNVDGVINVLDMVFVYLGWTG